MSDRWSDQDYANHLARRAIQTASVQPNGQAEIATGKSWTFTVFGLPQPGGSKQAFVPLDKKQTCMCTGIPVHPPFRRSNGGVLVTVTDDNKHVDKWKKHVARIAQEEYSGPLFTGAVSVRFVFFLPRPKNHFGTGANANRLKLDAPEFPLPRPDVLKLSRAVEDGLTQAGNVYVDDARIVDEDIKKRYGSPSRVEITIMEVLSERSDTNQPDLFEREELPPWEKHHT